MNILRKTVGFLAAAALAAGAVAPVGVAADSAAAEEKVTEENSFAVVTAGDEQADTEELSVSASDEQAYAEQYARLHDDPQYGKYLRDKALYDNTEESDLTPLSTLGEAGGGGGLVAVDKYSNSKLTHNPRFDNMDKVWGIDVSYFQYDINWSKVANDVDFAIIRVGYRGYGEAGDLVLDYKFKENIKEAKEAGLEVGVYFYTQAITSEEAREEADFVVKNLGDYSLELPVYFDIESVDYDEGRLDNADLTVAQKTQICKAFCNRIKKNGYEAGVYANKNWLENMIDGEELGAKYPIWLAHYTNETEYAGEYQTWQFSSTGKISGISTNVDMNVNYRTPENNILLPQPGNFRYSVESGVATFTCDPVEGANWYQLFSYDEETGAYTKVAVSGEPTISTELPDKCYGYVMRGVDTTGDKNLFSPYTSMVYAQKGMPANFSVEDAVGGAVKVSWDKLTEADGYVVYRAQGVNGVFERYRTLSASTSSMRETSLEENTCYGYKVAPIINGVEGVFTKEKWYITGVKQVTGVKVASSAADSITLKWTAVSNATGYEVAQYDAATKKYTKKATVTGTNTATISSLSPSTAYSFAVRAYTKAGDAKKYGSYSAVVTGTTILTAPAGLYATGSSSGVKLTWSAANGAAYYRVYRKTGSSFTRIADKVTALTYTDKTAPAVRTVYTVKAVYSIDGKLKISSGAKNSAVNAVPTQTSAYAITSRTSRIRIGWNAVSNCTGYKVYMYNSATKKYAAVKTVSSKNTTSCVVSGLKSGTKYKFKVRPYKKGVNGICWGKYSKAIGIWTK